MNDPGWYQVAGDPAGTKRYWTGSAWQGEPTRQAGAQNVIYYAEAPETEVDLGDVARRTTRAATPGSATQHSPYSNNSASVKVRRRKQLPEGLKTLTILISVFKALPLVSVAFGLVHVLRDTALSDTSLGRYSPPGLAFDASFGLTVLVFALMLGAGTMLIVAQAGAAIKDRASSLLSAASVMAFIDGVFLFQTLGSTQTNASRGVILGGALVVQVLIAVWAGLISRRSNR